ncbi:hypothetical protein ACHAXH_006740 [Discostella pseudostelligera]
MFSANENILLRQFKRRVVEYVESTIPESALELGTSVMVMQVSCRQPGCVPLETAITIVFPKPPRTKKTKRKEIIRKLIDTTDQQQAVNGEEKVIEDEPPSFPQPLIPNLEESRIGGSYKTRILKPLADVTLDDVLDALPPSFKGGRRTPLSLCLRVRDMMVAQIGQLCGDDDSRDSVEGRKVVAEYLRGYLEEYIAGGCIPPKWGEEYIGEGTGNDDGDEDKKFATSLGKIEVSPTDATNISERLP